MTLPTLRAGLPFSELEQSGRGGTHGRSWQWSGTTASEQAEAAVRCAELTNAAGSGRRRPFCGVELLTQNG